MEDKNKKSVPLQRDYSHSQLGRAATFAISEASASRRPPSRKLLERHRARAQRARHSVLISLTKMFTNLGRRRPPCPPASAPRRIRCSAATSAIATEQLSFRKRSATCLRTSVQQDQQPEPAQRLRARSPPPDGTSDAAPGAAAQRTDIGDRLNSARLPEGASDIKPVHTLFASTLISQASHTCLARV